MIDVKIKKSTSHPVDKNNIYVTLEISNDSEQDFYITRDALMLDGFRGNKFDIVKDKDASKLRYIGKNVKYIPDDFVLKANSKILSQELNLAQAYNFADAQPGDLYSVSFNSYAEYCTNIDHVNCFPVNLSGDLEIRIEGC